MPDPIEERVRQMNRLLTAAGFGSMKAGEIERILTQIESRKPIRGIRPQSDVAIPDVTPALGASRINALPAQPGDQRFMNPVATGRALPNLFGT